MMQTLTHDTILYNIDYKNYFIQNKLNVYSNIKLKLECNGNSIFLITSAAGIYLHDI